MTTAVENSFVKQFESEVFVEFQRMGSALRNTVRTKAGITGSSTTFQKIGKNGQAGSKDRHGNVPIMNVDRTPVEVILQDRYAGEYIDKLDELKVQHDERGIASQSVGWAMGRDVDDIITTALDATANANNISTAATWTAASSLLDLMTIIGNSNIPFDGNIYFAVCWEAWADLLDVDEFSNADYIQDEKLWFEGVTAKKWLGINWFPMENLPVDGSNDKKMFLYHRTAVGHALAQDFSLDVTWQGEKQAHLAVGSMSHGAKIIDDTGVIEVVYNSTP